MRLWRTISLKRRNTNQTSPSGESGGLRPFHTFCCTLHVWLSFGSVFHGPPWACALGCTSFACLRLPAFTIVTSATRHLVRAAQSSFSWACLVPRRFSAAPSGGPPTIETITHTPTPIWTPTPPSSTAFGSLTADGSFAKKRPRCEYGW